MGKATPATRAIVSTLYDTWIQHLAAGVQALNDSGEINANTQRQTVRLGQSVITAWPDPVRTALPQTSELAG
jgi:hypothetical protein